MAPRAALCLVLFTVSCALVCSLPVAAKTLDFADAQHGEPIAYNRYATLGVYVSIVANNGQLLPIAFDTGLSGTADSDLEGPPGGDWASGNQVGVPLGRAVIIPDNNTDGNNDGFVDNPNDSAAGGQIIIEFDEPLWSLGFTWADFDEENVTLDFYLDGANLNKQIDFGDFVTPANPFYDATIDLGDHSANKIEEISVDDLNAHLGGADITMFDEVRFTLPGSGGLPTIEYNAVPEPGTVVVFLLGLAGLEMWRRRRKQD